MIGSFHDQGTEDISDGRASAVARRKYSSVVWAIARRKLDQLSRARKPRELAVPPGNNLEALRGDRRGQFNIRINDRYRICFRWESGHAYEVKIADYH